MGFIVTRAPLVCMDRRKFRTGSNLPKGFINRLAVG